MNLVLLKARIKNELIDVIGRYESAYKLPVFVTSAVLSEIMCEVKSIEMLEMLKGDNGKNGKPTSEGHRDDDEKNG